MKPYKASATLRATVPLPDATGPSIVMTGASRQCTFSEEPHSIKAQRRISRECRLYTFPGATSNKDGRHPKS